jgi:signal transduction histidine kinase
MPKKKSIKRHFFLLIAGVVIFFSGYTVLIRYTQNFSSTEKLGAHFSQILKNKKAFSLHELEFLTGYADRTAPENWIAEYPQEKRKKNLKENISFFIYENDRLLFWSDHTIPLPEYYVYNYFSNPVINSGNGIFYPVLKKKKNRKYLALIKLKDEYTVSNQYLTNTFTSDFRIPENARITTQADAKLILKDPDGVPLLFLTHDPFRPEWAQWLIILLLLSGLGTLFYLFFRLSTFFLRKRHVLVYFILTSAAGALTLFISPVNTPFLIPDLRIFGPELYAGELFSSLGSYYLFTCWLLYVSMGLFTILSNWKIKSSGRSLLPAVTITGIGSVMLYGIFILVQDLVVNSQTYPLPEKLPELNIYRISVGVCLMLNLLSLRFILYGMAKPFQRSFSPIQLLSGAVVCLILLLAQHFTQKFPAFFITAFCFSYVALTEKSTRNIFHYLLIGGATGLFFSLSATKPLIVKKENEAALIGAKMASENDPLTEYLFEGIKNRIENDRDFRTAIFSSSGLNDGFTELFIKKYFNGFWLKYGVSAGIFDTPTRARLNLNNAGVFDFEYYAEIIENSGTATATENLWFIRKPSGKMAYMARLDFRDTLPAGTSFRTVFLEFTSRTINETSGLPDILLDNSFLSNRVMEGYSYARYTNNRLVSESGAYTYFADLNEWKPFFLNRKKAEHLGYSHYLQKNESGDVLIISRKTEGLGDYITRFSWWFLAALLLLAAERAAAAGGPGRFLGKTAGFKQKIQLLIVCTLSLFFIVMVRVSVSFLSRQYEQQNRRLVSDKLHAVNLNLQESMGGKLSRIPEQKAYLEYTLSELGTLFGTDINLYGTGGMLISGSRPELYTQNFISERMNPEALQTARKNSTTEFLKNEQIGNLRYISAYAPLFDEDGKPAAYLNIPYFAKQKEINQEISDSANALVNIFISSVTLLLTLVLLITNRIIDPLRELGKKLRELRYGAKTGKIHYAGEDEIGRLVKEYNRLTDELEKSANLLAEKERDSAWREMARQVAHEIKNPLTPMKLNVEFLEKAWKDKTPDFPERMVRFKSMMIEQIDTLSHIADEFSNFAKLPPPRKEVTDLNEILESVAALYTKNEKNVEVHFHRNETPLHVYGDKEQLLRVFNNLIKNAIQSIPENKQGHVDIFGFTDENNLTILVKDNGTGIPEDLRDRIFTPNFTTKGSGSGLGLAICRNIVRESGGEIDFLTQTGEGTTFRTVLPYWKMG